MANEGQQTGTNGPHHCIATASTVSVAYSSRDLHRAAQIYQMMLSDPDCGIILCMAGSLVSARSSTTE